MKQLDKFFLCGFLLIVLLLTPLARADEPEVFDQIVNGKRFTLPRGLLIELVADSTLVDRPVNCDFDEHGRLYVTRSSGSNEKVTEQLKKKPHSIVRLEDTNGDGRYDKRTNFADKLMFPAGAMWHDGSLYVAAPPQIWKFTDTNDDGVADRREVWFDGKTLTGCANDLHGPYLGPDGWIYWCKGAFAEQSYDHQDAPRFVTRASHIFRRRPEGGPVEHVMTGGMDNPVEVVFAPDGERIFNSTFLHHPRDGKRDGLVHALYGGVYGKEHGVLEGHPRTGDLLPVLADHDASAPSGLIRLESAHFGADYQHNLLCSSFNMHKIFRHRLSYNGSMLQTRNEDFVVCHDLDFHPTDVIEDADGSVLIVDTGGWYKLCCPTSQLHKPDVLGAIYRVRRTDAARVVDPYGKKMKADSADWLQHLNDPRPFVRRQAQQQVSQRNQSKRLVKILRDTQSPQDLRLQTVWALVKDPTPAARQAIRLALRDPVEQVRQAAAHGAAIWKDQDALADLCKLLKSNSSANRRVAAEALGRLKNSAAIEPLLQSAAELRTQEDSPGYMIDRGLEHSIIYALIEIGDDRSLVARLDRNRLHPSAAHVVMMALTELTHDQSRKDILLRWLNGEDRLLRATAWRIIKQNPGWADDLAPFFRGEFERGIASHDQLISLTGNRSIQKEILRVLLSKDKSYSTGLKSRLIDIVARSKPEKLEREWLSVPEQTLSADSKELWLPTLRMIQAIPYFGQANYDVRLQRIASEPTAEGAVRLQAFTAMKTFHFSSTDFEFVSSHLRSDQPVFMRSTAVEAFRGASLTDPQASRLAALIAESGPTELLPLLKLLVKYKSDKLGAQVLRSLQNSAVATSVELDALRKVLSAFGPKLAEKSKELMKKIEHEKSTKLVRMNKILALVDKGDVRRGQEIFHSAKASCIACHQMGYLGGRIGPSLSRIGNIRSEQDLLESLMYPNQSFVRSYEPVVIETVDGLLHSGMIKNETANQIELIIDAQKSKVIAKSDIENRKVGTQSVMPSGLDKQFSDQELADLIRFLKFAR